MLVRRGFFISAALVALLGGAATAAVRTNELDGLHDALRLHGDQETAWRAYVAAVTPSKDAEARRRAAATMAASLETPRRIDLLNAQMEADLVELRRQGEAVKAFYGVLDADQKRTFDRLTYRQPPGGADQGGGRRPN